MPPTKDDDGKGNSERMEPTGAKFKSVPATARLLKDWERLQGTASALATSRLFEDVFKAQEATRSLFDLPTFEAIKSRAFEDAQKVNQALFSQRGELDWLTKSSAIGVAREFSGIAGLERTRLEWIDAARKIVPSVTGLETLYGTTSPLEALRHLQKNHVDVLAGGGPLHALTRRIQENTKFHSGEFAGVTSTIALLKQHFADLATTGISPNLLTDAFTAQSILDAGRDYSVSLRQQSPLMEIVAGLDEQLLATPGDLDAASLTAFLEAFIAGLVERIAASGTWLERRSLADMFSFLALLLTLVTIYQVQEISENDSIEAEVLRSEIARVQDAIAGGAEQISEAVRNGLPDDEGGISYIVLRQVPLTETRKFREMRITTLYPNLIVQLVEARGKWISVTYFDHVLGKPVSGWVLKKYLRRLSRA